MKTLAALLAAALCAAAAAPAARAVPVDVTYALTGVISLPGLGPLGPPGSGSMILRYGATATAPVSLTQGPGAPVGLLSGPVHLESFGFAQSINFPVGGMLFSVAFSAAIAAAIGPAPSIALTFPLAPMPMGTFGGFPLTGMFTAQEVSRHLVPEPVSFPLLGLGLSGLAIATRRAGRARRR